MAAELTSVLRRARSFLELLQSDDSSAPLTIVRSGCVIALLSVLAQSVCHVIGAVFFDNDVVTLNVDEEGNIFSWAGSMSTWAAALLVFVPAVAGGTLTLGSAVLAFGIAFFSVDDAVTLHERLAEKAVDVLNAPMWAERALWPPVWFPLLAVVLVLLLRLALSAREYVALPILFGLVLLGFAVFLEVTAAFYITGDPNNWQAGTEVILEEGAELAGWILIATGLAAQAYVAAEEA